MPRHDKTTTAPEHRRAPKGSIVETLRVPAGEDEVHDVDLLVAHLRAHPSAHPMHPATKAGALRWAARETVKRLGLRPPQPMAGVPASNRGLCSDAAPGPIASKKTSRRR